MGKPGMWFLSFTCLVFSAGAAWDVDHRRQRFLYQLKCSGCSHQPEDMVATAAGDGKGDEAPLVTKPLERQ